MNWNKLEDIDQLNIIDEESKSGKVLIFKDSTRCSISIASLNRIERNWKEGDEGKLKPYYLDLLNHRDISNEIAARYHVIHESPQVLIIQNGKCVYHISQSAINYNEIISLA